MRSHDSRRSSARGLLSGTTRRHLLQGGAAALVAGGAGAAERGGLGRSAAQTPVTPAAEAAAGRLSGPALLDAFVRMRGRSDGRIVFGWLRSKRSAVVGPEVTPLFDVLAGAISRFERLGDDLVEASILEIAYYVHPRTGELLRTLRMPGTRDDVAVPIYRFGPVKARFGVSHDEWEEFEPAQGGSSAGSFAPRASIHLVRSLGEVMAYGSRVQFTAHEFGRAYADRAKPPNVYYREWTTWYAEATDLEERARPSIPSTYGYTALTSWRPWMRMGAAPGHTLDHGAGAKADDWSGCNPAYLALLRQHHPEVLDAPERALASKPV